MPLNMRLCVISNFSMKTIGIIIQKKNPLISLNSVARVSLLNPDLNVVIMGIPEYVVNQGFKNQI